MNKMRSSSLRRSLVPGAVIVGAFVAAGGCGNGDEDGRCKPARNSGYVAATEDPWGDPWKLTISPKSYSVRCASSTDEGTLTFMAVIKDSLKRSIGGLSINAAAGSINSILELKVADTNTDSCGAAFFTVSWKCPANAGEQRGASLVVFSGALSESADVSIEHYQVTRTGDAK